MSDKISPREAARLIGVTSNTILVYAKSGKIPYTKVMSRFYFEKEDILALVKHVKPHKSIEQLT